MNPASAAIELTRDLVRMDTINPPGQELECARTLAAQLEEAGFITRLHPMGEGRANLVARIGNGNGKPLCITGHIDTVPLGGAPWSRGPLAGDTDQGKLYGRGSSDMKSGLAAVVIAACELAPRLVNTPGLELVLTAGEETGCDGAAALANEQGALGRAGAILVAEPTDNLPLLGHKGSLWLEACTHGVTAHGSMPERGDNALYKAARAIGKLEQFDFESPPHEIMGSPTLNVGTLHGGLNVNSVPDKAVMEIDIRSVPNCPHDKIKALLKKALGDEVDLNPIADLESVYTPPEHPWAERVFELVTPYLGERPAPQVATYFTDAGYLAPAYGHPPTIILGPGEAAMAHQTDEYCVMSLIEDAVGIYTDIIRDWCSI